jgi:hypothetical protein
MPLVVAALGDVRRAESTPTFILLERGDGLRLTGDAPFIKDAREGESPNWRDNGDKEDLYDRGF